MWRLVSLKTLLVLILLVIGITILIVSNKQIKIAQKIERQEAQFAKSQDKDYYSETGNQKIHDSLQDDLGDNKNDDNDFDPMSAPGIGHKSNAQCPSSSTQTITCNINSGKYLLTDCRKDLATNEVYIPFNFLQKYFEVYGKLSPETDPPTFNWFHCPPIKIYRLQSPYDPRQGLAYFENYNVEVRERVKCVSGASGVPVSTQWDPKGYYYPIQIAQFGLSHYSKFMSTVITNGGNGHKPTVLENGDTVRGDWGKSQPTTVLDPQSKINTVIKIKKGTQGLRLANVPIQPHALVVSWSMRHDHLTAEPNSTITISLTYERVRYDLHYTSGDYFIQVKNNQIFHGLGSKSSSAWHHVIRDLGVDLQKGIALQQQQESPKKKSKAKLTGIRISRSKILINSFQVSNFNLPQGTLLLDNITISLNEHLGQFFQSVDWFVENQDPRGGWPIPVSRKFHSSSSGSGNLLTLQPGWYSAMAQGHALSLLSRAYHLTKKQNYAQACSRAMESIFDQSGQAHGVRAVFLDNYSWYEEYPTSPPSFVLNGFMYSLIGLYDVVALKIPGAETKARSLYSSGIRSLISMLPLYDTGSGSMYDLRHFSLPGLPPNLARLDYHLTHINQLLIFSTISNNAIFNTTVERWIKYTEGQRAPHN